MLSKLYKPALFIFFSLYFSHAQAYDKQEVKEKYNQWLDLSDLGKILRADSLVVRYQNAGNDAAYGQKKTYVLYLGFPGNYQSPARVWYLVKEEFNRRGIDIREQLRLRLKQLLHSPGITSAQIIIPTDDVSFKGIDKEKELKTLNFDFEKVLSYSLINQYVVLRNLGSLKPFEKALIGLFERYNHPPNAKVEVRLLKETGDGMVFHVSNVYGEATHASYYELIVLDVDLKQRLTEKKDVVSEITIRIIGLQYAGGIGKSPVKDEDYDGDMESDFPIQVRNYFSELGQDIKTIIK